MANTFMLLYQTDHYFPSLEAPSPLFPVYILIG